MDWSIPQLVASDNKSIIVMTDGKCSENRFGGTIVQNDKHVGMYLPDFYKNAFKPCNVIVEFK